MNILDAVLAQRTLTDQATDAAPAFTDTGSGILSEAQMDNAISDALADPPDDRSPQTLRDVKLWIGEINPDYDPYRLYSDYAVNCGSCALAVSRRLDGQENAVACEKNIPDSEQMAEITGNGFLSGVTPNDISDSVLSAGPGGHLIVGIDRYFGPGHWLNAWTPDGEKVYYIDGQVAEIKTWPPEDLGWISNWEMELKDGYLQPAHSNSMRVTPADQ